MARTLEEIRASRPKVDRAKLDATTEADIRQHAIADGEDPDAPLPEFKLVKRRPGERGPGKKPAKVQTTIRVDADALNAWKALGPRWQSQLSQMMVLRAPKGSVNERTVATGSALKPKKTMKSAVSMAASKLSKNAKTGSGDKVSVATGSAASKKQRA